MAFKHSFDSDTADAGKWEVSGRIIRETDKAILLDDGTTEQWLPKRKVRITTGRGGLVEVTMSEWLAKEKGYV